MAITIKEALDYNDKMLTKSLEDICDFIDNFIVTNILELLTKPMIIRIPSEYCNGRIQPYIKDIEIRYKEFTVQFMGSISYTSIRIKLADKDWDWNGYGIKNEKKESQLGKFAEETIQGLKFEAFKTQDGGYMVRNTKHDFDVVNEPDKSNTINRGFKWLLGIK